MNSLDGRTAREKLDRDGAFERNRGLPEQCAEAWQAAKGFRLPAVYASPTNLVVTGMGGSAISGDILQSLALATAPAPISVSRGYHLPAWVGPDSLVVACSHSGNTSETLSAFEHARHLGARTVAITTGGQLLEMASRHEVPALTYSYAAEPRSALGHTLLRILAVARAAGFYEVEDGTIADAVGSLQSLRLAIDESVPETANPAKQIARRLYGRLPLVVGGDYLAPTARRWKTQINENAKAWAMADELPEMHHNTVVGLRLAEPVAGLVHAVLLEHDLLGETMLTRSRLTLGVLAARSISHERLDVGGNNRIQAVLRAVYYANYVSYYLALLNDVNPWEVEAIDRLKKELGAQ